jgi:hypothetical protein
VIDQIVADGETQRVVEIVGCCGSVGKHRFKSFPENVPVVAQRLA